MEFDHVFILDGGWDRRQAGARKEEETRLYYVAMTRARNTLCLMQREDTSNPRPEDMKGDFILRRRAAPAPLKPTDAVPKAGFRGYEMLGLQDLHLGYAARFPAHHSIHEALASLQPGMPLEMVEKGRNILLTSGNVPVARLSRSAYDQWHDRAATIHSIRVAAMVRRFGDQGEAGYQDACRVDAWEVPVAEVRLTGRSGAGLRRS